LTGRSAQANAVTGGSPSGETIRVLVADSDAGFRGLLRDALAEEKGLALVGECCDGQDVPLLCSSLAPHVAVLNLHLPRVDGAEATFRLCQTAPQTKVLVISDGDDPCAIEAIRSGATGYLLKNMGIGSIVEAVKVIARGGVYIHPIAMVRLLGEFRRLSRMEGAMHHLHTESRAVPWQEVLTAREMEVLRLMSQGKNNRAISEHLYISEKTVKNHVSNILYKLNVQDRTQAVLAAIRYGWVRLL
jgi:two-component system response regulator DegU